jgi:hypothetical protein
MANKEVSRQIILHCRDAQETMEAIREVNVQKAECVNPECGAKFVRGEHPKMQVNDEFWLEPSMIYCTGLATEIEGEEAILGRFTDATPDVVREKHISKYELLLKEAERLGIKDYI